jgi:hypothetical protein
VRQLDRKKSIAFNVLDHPLLSLLLLINAPRARVAHIIPARPHAAFVSVGGFPWEVHLENILTNEVACVILSSAKMAEYVRNRDLLISAPTGGSGGAASTITDNR